MQKGLRAAAVVTLALVIVGLALLQPVSGQPGQWKAINPIFANLNDVWMISSSSGWAVGEEGRAVYWDGSKWSEMLTPFTGNAQYHLESVSCLSATRCLAVGYHAPGPPPLAVLIQWDGTAWVDRSTLIPLGTTGLHDIFVRSDGLTYAVGDGNPNIIRIPDANTVPVAPVVEFAAVTPPGPNPDVLHSIWLLPPGSGAGAVFGFAAGNPWGVPAGSTWRWDGGVGGWHYENPGATGILQGVQVLSPTDALAVGNGDSRTRWNGATWTPEGGAVIAGAVWRSAFMLSPTDQWIVGEVAAPSVYASIAHWVGAAWSAFAPPNVPVTVDLNSVYMLSASDGWAVGDGGAIIRWNGSNWNSVASPAAGLRGVWLSSSSDGWAVGDGGAIIRWNGANWNFYQTSPVAAHLNEIHGSASTNVFAVGNDPDGLGGSPPAIIRWAGGPAWVNISPAGVADNVNLHGVYAVSPSLAFAVGDAPGLGSPATMLRWDGTLWASIVSGTPNGVSLKSVWMVSGSDGWAVGDGPIVGTIVRWTGAAWAAETSPPGTPQLNAVQALTSTNVWAVGNGGTIIHRDATAWSLVPSPVAQNLNSLYMISANEGWAVGVNAGGWPIILYWDGSTWTRVNPVPAVSRDLEDVWMVASTDGWAVGQSGLIERFGPGPVTTVTTVPVTATSTTTQYVTSTSWVATSTVSTQITSTETVPTTATSTTWIVTTGTFGLPPSSPVPGFPFESILAGLFAGAAALLMLRRRRRT